MAMMHAALAPRPHAAVLHMCNSAHADDDTFILVRILQRTHRDFIHSRSELSKLLNHSLTISRVVRPCIRAFSHFLVLLKLPCLGIGMRDHQLVQTLLQAGSRYDALLRKTSITSSCQPVQLVLLRLNMSIQAPNVCLQI